MTMEPSEAVAVLEVALRSAIREVLPEWQSKLPADAIERLEAKRTEDSQRRDGTIASPDLLEYTETTQLTDLVERNWEPFKPIFQDLARTKVVFGLAKDYRNPAQHNRELVEFERELLSGSAQQIRNQVAIYRGTSASPSRYYPVIESALDNFGREGVWEVRAGRHDPDPRVDVGDVIEIRARGLSARGFPLQWWVHLGTDLDAVMAYDFNANPAPTVVGDEVVMRYTVKESDVGESKVLLVRMASTSSHHRRGNMDDVRYLYYAVNPPEDA